MKEHGIRIGDGDENENGRRIERKGRSADA